jgi:hypothetical protein
VFALIITKYILFEYRANKAAQILYPFSAWEIYELCGLTPSVLSFYRFCRTLRKQPYQAPDAPVSDLVAWKQDRKDWQGMLPHPALPPPSLKGLRVVYFARASGTLCQN